MIKQTPKLDSERKTLYYVGFNFNFWTLNFSLRRRRREYLSCYNHIAKIASDEVEAKSHVIVFMVLNVVRITVSKRGPPSSHPSHPHLFTFLSLSLHPVIRPVEYT